MNGLGKRRLEVQQAALFQSVNAATTLSDLLSILNCITLPKLKRFVYSEIKQMDGRTTTITYCNAIPIDAILPEDITQHILSFDGYCHQSICKKWKQLDKVNKENALREVYASSLSVYDPSTSVRSGKTWIIHPNLESRKSHLGFSGVIKSTGRGYQNSLRIGGELGAVWQMGDTMLFHEGQYEFPHSVEPDIKIMGVGQREKIMFNSSLEYPTFPVDLYFENVTVNFRYGYTTLWAGHLLEMKNCILKHPNSKLSVQSKATLIMDQCILDGSFWESERLGWRFQIQEHAIQISPFAASVRITNCIFREVSKGILFPTEDEPSELETSNAVSTNITICDNVFEDIEGAPLETHDERICKLLKKSNVSITGNIQKSSGGERLHHDPNEILLLSEDEGQRDVGQPPNFLWTF